MRAFWPFTRDPVTVDLLKREQPYPVAACWNGVVAFKAEPYLYGSANAVESSQNLSKRGWKMIDNCASMFWS